jgi:cell division protein FtsB
MWAEHDHSMKESIAWFANRHRRPADPAALLAQNQTLAAENAQLRQELADYKRNYVELDAWARRAERQIDQLLKDRGE